MKNNTLHIFKVIALMLCMFSLNAQDQPTTPITPIQKEYNQYTKVCLNATNSITTFKHNTLVTHGSMNTYAEFAFNVEIDHFAATFIPINNYTTAELEFTLNLDGTAYSMTMLNGNQLSLMDGTVLYTQTINVDDVIIIGYDDLQVIYKINDEILHTEAILSEPELAIARLDPINATDACFYFFFDMEFRNSALAVNFVETSSIVQEGEMANLCIDLTAANTTPDPIIAIISVRDPVDPHFTTLEDLTVTIPSGNDEAVCIDVPTEIGNTLKDENLFYVFEIVYVSGMNVAIGEQNTHRVEIIDDYVPYNNNLVPGDLMFVGLETDIGMGEDQIVVTNLVELNPGTKFQITNGKYQAAGDKFRGHYFNGFSITEFEYVGDEPLEVNSILCIYTGLREETDRTFISRIDTNGVEATDLFDLDNIGSSDLNSIQVDVTTSKGLFLTQGHWNHPNLSESKLLGKVIHAIQVGEDWSVEEFPDNNLSNEHPDIECIPVIALASGWAYFQCQTPYNRITIFDLQAQISDFSNWIGGNGDDQVNWPVGVDVCVSTCDIGEYDPLAIAVDDVTVYCDGTADPNGEIAAWLEDQLNTSVTGGAYAVSVVSDFGNIVIAPDACNTYEVAFTATDGAGEMVSAVGYVSVLDVTAPVFKNTMPTHTTITDCSSAFDIAMHIEDECSDVIVTTTEVEVSFVPNDYNVVEVEYIIEDACGNTNSFVQTQTREQGNIEVAIFGVADVYCQNTYTNGYNYDLSSNVSNTSGQVTYEWVYTAENGEIVKTGDQSSLSLDYMDRPSGIVSLRIRNNGCTAYDEVAIVGSQFGFEEDHEDILFCEGDPVTIQASPINAIGNNITYEWKGGYNYTLTYGTGQTFTWDPLIMSNNVKLIAKDNHPGTLNCAAEKTFYFDYVSESIEINGPSIVCPGETITLDVDYSDNPSSSDEFRWLVDDGSGYVELMGNSDFDWDDDYITGEINQNTQFMIEVTYNDGCVFYDEFEITIDNIDPVINNCPSNLNVACTYTLEDFISSVSVSDDCNLSSITQSPVAGTSLTGALHPIVIIATDVAGNQSQCSFEISIEDNAPIISNCPGNISRTCPYTIIDFTSVPTITDDCSTFEVTQVPANGISLGPGIHMVTLTAEDVTGNQASCSFQINVVDNPTLTLNRPPDVTIDCSGNCCPTGTGSATASYGSACGSISVGVSFSDNTPTQSCAGGLLFRQAAGDDEASSCQDCGIITRTWTANHNGQSISLDQTITIAESDPPDFIVPSNRKVCLVQIDDLVVAGEATSFTDDCTQNYDDFESYYTDDPVNPNSSTTSITRTWTVVDKCGNSTDKIQILTIDPCQPLASQSFSIYPNPTTDKFYLEYNSETSEIVDLQLYKMSGELVRSSKIEMVKGDNIHEVNTLDLVPAMYLVKLRTSDQEFIEKVVIVKN